MFFTKGRSQGVFFLFCPLALLESQHMNLGCIFLKKQSFRLLVLFLFSFLATELRASTCDKSAKPEIMGDGKVNTDKFEYAMLNVVDEKAFEYWYIEKGLKFVPDSPEKRRQLAEAKDQVDAEAAAAFVNLGVILEKSERKIGFPERPVYHISTRGEHHINKMAKRLSEELYGLKIRFVKDLEGSTQATYSGAFNEITLPLNLFKNFSVTNRSIGHELTHAINHLEGSSNFGKIGVLNSDSSLPHRKALSYEKTMALDEHEAHMFSFLSLMAEYSASLKDTNTENSKRILEDIKSKAILLDGISKSLLTIAPALVVSAVDGNIKIQEKSMGGRNPLFFDDPNILAYASMHFESEATEFYYKVPIYKEDMRSLIMGQQTEKQLGKAFELSMRTSEEILESQYKIIAEQKVHDFAQYILSMESLMPIVLDAANTIVQAKDKSKAMEKLVHSPELSHLARVGISETDLIDLFAKLALDGEDYIRYWGIEPIN